MTSQEGIFDPGSRRFRYLLSLSLAIDLGVEYNLLVK